MTATKIEWTDRTPPLRVRATAAARIGITLAEYDRRLDAGEKWCGGCRAWHDRAAFAADRSRGDGMASRCRDSVNAAARASYQPRDRENGRRYVEARPGDVAQARRRVNYLVEIGHLPRPDSEPCADCGHIWAGGERRHEYDHHLGYAPEHHEDVEPVCTTCHHAREEARRAAA